MKVLAPPDHDRVVDGWLLPWSGVLPCRGGGRVAFVSSIDVFGRRSVDRLAARIGEAFPAVSVGVFHSRGDGRRAGRNGSSRTWRRAVTSARRRRISIVRERGLGKEVLIVDDCEDIADACSFALREMLGCNVRWAADGGAGLAAVAAERPDLIVLDMMMPEVDGLEFLERLPSVTQLAPPVLAYSGFDKLAELAVARGAAAFLQKPFGLDDLVGLARSLLTGVRPAVERRPSADASTARAEAAAHRERFWRGRPSLGAELSRSLGWLVRGAARYFGAARAFVTALHDGGLHVLAVHGAADQFPVGCAMEPRINFCPDVIAANTPLVLRDCAASPAFAAHPATGTGVRFYAGAPLVGESGIALGTLCIEHLEPHAFGAEDLALLRHIAGLVGDGIEREARGGAGTPPFVADGVVHPRLFGVIVDAELRRAERDGNTVELALLSAAPSRVGTRMAVTTHPAGALVLVGGGASHRLVQRPIARIQHRPQAGAPMTPRELLGALESARRA